MDKDSVARNDGLTVAITGSGGSGAVTAGQILLEAVARSGRYGLMTRSAGPQIRGGESAAMVRFSSRPVDCMGDRYDLLLGLDWGNVDRFVDEIPLDANSLILSDPANGEVPQMLLDAGARVQEVPFKAHAGAVEGGRANMAAVGALCAVAGLPLSVLEQAVADILARKGDAVVRSSLECVRSAYRRNTSEDAGHAPELSYEGRWNISGNEAAGLGALRGGIRFVAAYPITPATEVLEWMAPRLEQVGGALLQAEDELASVNMIIGSSFGGVPSLTATSGPGLALMTEGLGLALTSETPVVVVNVMRGGPSTGIPTKSEQSDLNIALYGFHGDAPHLVLAALNIADCVTATQWAVHLAEHLQTVAIVLSDQSLGQSRSIIDPPALLQDMPGRVVEDSPSEGYRRYRLTDDGVSPMSVPGTAEGMYTGDGLEHNQVGTPSSMAGDHNDQLEKRRRKVVDFDYGDLWAEIRGVGEFCIISWGSASGAAFEAAQRLTEAGRPARVVAMRLIAPLRRDELLQALDGAGRVLVVEQNQGAQLFHYLHSRQALPADARSYARPGPLPLRPRDIVAAIDQEN